jgi:hypothetical protein
MLTLLALPCGWSFPGYLQLVQQDAATSLAIGCIPPTWATPNVSKAVCDGNAACQVFSDLTFRAFKSDPSKITFMSTTRCVGAQTGGNVSGGCGTAPQRYWQCAGSAGGFTAINPTPFILPPGAVEQACNNNLACVGFVINAIGTQGTLLTPAVDATAKYALKVPSASPSPPQALVARSSAAEGTLPGFVSVPYDLGSECFSQRRSLGRRLPVGFFLTSLCEWSSIAANSRSAMAKGFAPSGQKEWFCAQVTALRAPPSFPPIVVKFIATADGSDMALALPRPNSAYVIKADTKPMAQ